MSKKKETKLSDAGRILAATALITKIIGLAYRIPVTNIMGAEGNGYYGMVFQVYNLALMLTSYSPPTAVSKLVSARVATGSTAMHTAFSRGAMTFAMIAGGIVTAIVFFGEAIHCDRYYEDGSVRLCTPCTGTMYSGCCISWCIPWVLSGLRNHDPYGGITDCRADHQCDRKYCWRIHVIKGWTEFRIRSRQEILWSSLRSSRCATLGTVAGALAALVFLILLFCVFRKDFKKQMKHDTEHRTESGKHIAKVLLFTIAPVILSATVYNISNLLDQAVFTNAMAAQGMPKKEYTELLGMFSGQYDTITNIPLSVASALAASFMPSLVATIQTGSRKEIHNKIDLVSRFNMIIAIPCAAAFITLGKPILDPSDFTQDNTIPAMLLKIGGISVVFFCLSTVTNAALQGMDHMSQPVKNAAISLVIHLVALYIMLVAFHWNIYSIVASKIIFAAAICVLNDRDLRKCSGYVQEYRRTFIIPGIRNYYEYCGTWCSSGV